MKLLRRRLKPNRHEIFFMALQGLATSRFFVTVDTCWCQSMRRDRESGLVNFSLIDVGWIVGAPRNVLIACPRPFQAH